MNIFVLSSVFVFILWTVAGAGNLSDIAGVIWLYNLFWMTSVVVNVSCLYLNLPTTSMDVYARVCGRFDRSAQDFGKRQIEELHSKVHEDYLRMTDSGLK